MRSLSLLLLAGLLLVLPQSLLAGDKLRQVKEDSKRIQQGTVLVAPILPDSFVLRKWKDPQQQQAYLDDLAAGTKALQAAMKGRYTFSKIVLLPPCADYAAYKSALTRYDAKNHFVLQMGHMAQFMGPKTKRLSNYDKAFLGIYELDGTTRMVLRTAKARILAKQSYADAIVESFQRLLRSYVKVKGGPKSDLLVPSLEGKVALLPQERLHGGDSLTFLDGQYQTVVTTLPLKVFRAFGGTAGPGGTFVGLDTIADTAATRRDLAILLAWGNTLAYEAVIEVPVATKLNIGRAAPQLGLPGGGVQIIMPYQWNTAWIRRIYSTRGEGSWTIGEFEKAFPVYFRD